MRLAFGVEYLGSAYYGWQIQEGLDTVELRLTQALSQIADQPVAISCAGRTDVGVHALGQVIHLEVDKHRHDTAWLLGTNSCLPRDIQVVWVRPVPENFHARFSALARRYVYFIDNRPVHSALYQHTQYRLFYQLEAHRMHEAAQSLVGEHDFSAFRSSECQSSSAFRCVHHVSVRRHEHLVRIEIQANAFLHHMVRNIVGSLILIGRGIEPIEWMAGVLSSKDRKVAGPMAPSKGLTLRSVTYPDVFNLPAPIGYREMDL